MSPASRLIAFALNMNFLHLTGPGFTYIKINMIVVMITNIGLTATAMELGAAIYDNRYIFKKHFMEWCESL